MSDASPNPQAPLAYERVQVDPRPGAERTFQYVLSTLRLLELLALLAALASASMVLARWLRPAPDADTDGSGLDWDWVWRALLAGAIFAFLVFLRALLTGDANIILKQMRQRALGTWLT